jgi:Xaa-Pro dipeptidase
VIADPLPAPGTSFASPARIPDAEFPERRARAAAAARAAGFDGLLVAGRSSGSLDMAFNVHWLTRHYFVPPAVVPTGFWHAYGFDFLLVDGDGRSALASCGTTDAPVIDDIRLGLDVEQLLVDAIRDLGLERARLGLAGSEVLPWTVAHRLQREFPHLVLKPADLLMSQVRLTLSPAECDLVRQSVAAGSRMLNAGLAAARVGATDGDVAAAGWGIAARTERQQHWNFIMASGPISGEYAAGSLPSWDPVRRYESGDLIHPDCYGYLDGAMYDVQRSVVIGAPPTPRQQWLIDGSWDQAQTLGNALRDGITCREIYELGVAFNQSRGYGGRDEVRQSWEEGGHFGHGYSSGFDWPWLGVTGPLVDEPLRAPFAVTIELYWQERGVGQAWVEENWLVLPDGSERLSASLPKTLAPDGSPVWA